MDLSFHCTLGEVQNEGMNHNTVLRPLQGCKDNGMHDGVSSPED